MRTSYLAPLGTFSKGFLTGTLAAALVTAAVPFSGSAETPASPAAHASGLDDATIVAIFDAANTWDIETGSIASTKGHDKEVRAYGKMLVRDHSMVRQQGRDLAKKLGVTPTPPKDFAMYTDHLAALKKIRSVRGEKFDRAFLENEVAYHKAVIDAVTTTLLPAIHNAELKAFVVKIAPAFQAHMLRAQAILDAEKKEAN